MQRVERTICYSPSVTLPVNRGFQGAEPPLNKCENEIFFDFLTSSCKIGKTIFEVCRVCRVHIPVSPILFLNFRIKKVWEKIVSTLHTPHSVAEDDNGVMKSLHCTLHTLHSPGAPGKRHGHSTRRGEQKQNDQAVHQLLGRFYAAINNQSPNGRNDLSSPSSFPKGSAEMSRDGV